MPLSVNGVRDLGPVGKGGSGAHFLYCDDDSEYIVKFADNTKTIINEFVCGSIATKINLPTPTVTLVKLNQELIDSSSDLESRQIKPGLHLGFTKLSNAVDFQQLSAQLPVGRNLENSQELYGVICFDNWMLNSDRNNIGNNMIQLKANNLMHYYMVDFGHCFTNNNWDESLQNSRDHVQIVGFLEYFLQYIVNFSDFGYWINRIAGFQDKEVDDIINSIPPSWSITPAEKLILSEIIKYRRGLVNLIITNNRSLLGV